MPRSGPVPQSAALASDLSGPLVLVSPADTDPAALLAALRSPDAVEYFGHPLVSLTDLTSIAPRLDPLAPTAVLASALSINYILSYMSSRPL